MCFIGVVYENIHVKVHLKALICNVPDKFLALNFKVHPGQKSCLRCHTVGCLVNNRIYFPKLDYSLRTLEEFKL